MSDEKKIPRLGKAAGEFNVAIHAIVSVLKKNHFEIDEDPVKLQNTKLTPEMYEVLMNEFQREKMVKEDAKKLEIGVVTKKAEEVRHPEEIHIPPPVSVTRPVEEKPKVAPKPPKEVVQEEVVQKKEIEKTIVSEIITPKTEVTEIEIVNEVKAVAEIPSVNSIAPEEKDLSKPEHIKTVVEDLSKNIKVIDKIDVSQFDTRSHKKSKDKNRKDRKQDRAPLPMEPIKKEVKPEMKKEPIIKVTEERKPTISQPLVEPPKPEHIETKITKLPGITEVGKMNLDQFAPKAPAKKDNQEHAKSEKTNAERNRKKRKRIKHHSGKQSDEEKQKLLASKPEISKEDIEKQIKETKLRMEPLGKSKTSKRRREKRALIHTEMIESEMHELESQKTLKVTEFITASDLATLMNISVNQIISTCMSIGLFVSINQRLDAETISLLAEEFGFEVEFVGVDLDESVKAEEEDQPEDLETRHPIITVMGHVDHGKTSLLDYIRKTNVIAGEAGGITQHIGAYLVNLPDGRKITFLDTPGHEAFTAMRARGAKVTDLCIIVIAADDSVMPQTVEAINHAQAAGVPMVFAISKIDKANAAPEKIREALANMNILVEDWGGKYQCQEINSKQGTNVDTLLEKVLLEAEMLDLKSNPNKNGSGTVLESSLDKGKGYVAKVLIQNGTIKIGDPILAGSYFGKVKALFNERNQPLKEAGPATPLLLLGLNGAPQAGDVLKVCTSEHDARIAATKRAQLTREMGLRTQKHITLDEIGRRIAIGDFKELNIIVKGDVDGSIEALSDSLLKLSTEQVQVNVIHKSVGAVTESDVLLASASNAIIVAFQVRPSPSARKLAEQEQIDIRIYSIIYTAINEIKDAIAGMHTPEIREKILCNLEVREVFKITKVGNIAGCLSLDGKLQRNTKIRLIRDGIVIYSGKLGALKRFKDDVKEVVAGQDCGLNIENFNDIKVGDIIEGYEEYEVKVTL